ncbi:MAG: glycosyltransferase family 4 protein [Gammaproteobacteria bacterium]|nr:glycosyltransferase family 4 protein [Gammaproteobacteria bacterium]MYF54029.1 glycosyltransferase family 4 protein [Gammaproteobacteria bacterium]MYK43912.1 glycosyltransferase family 4 protein [Gammaproteobacteria bacterium]
MTAKQKPLKVIQVLPRLESGGVERGVCEVVCYLKDHGHEPIVISEGGKMVELLNSIAVPHVKMQVGSKSLLSLLTIRKLRKFFIEQQPNVVHGRSRLPDWLCYLALKKIPEQTRPKFVTSVHGLHSVSRYSSIITKGERIEAVSDTAKDYLINNYTQVQESNIRVIHRGVDPSLYTPTFEPSQNWVNEWQKSMSTMNPDNLPILTIVGRVSRLKGHPHFLKIVENLNKSETCVIGLIVGEADQHHKRYAEKLQEQVKMSRELHQKVFFLGNRSDIREIMSKSNVVLSLSSKPESFGRTVLEALSLGTPVVGFDHGGVSEILAELFPDGVVPYGDIGAATKKVTELMHRKVDLPTHKFTLENMCSQTLSMYQELVA